jgi:hypothetical protein
MDQARLNAAPGYNRECPQCRPLWSLTTVRSLQARPRANTGWAEGFGRAEDPLSFAQHNAEVLQRKDFRAREGVDMAKKGKKDKKGKKGKKK